MSGIITIKDRQFKPFISQDKIAAAVRKLAAEINADLQDECPLFMAVLNGSFMFAADLLKEIEIPCEISFIKVASYHGTSSSGQVTELIGIAENLENRTVVIIEDIVDSGITIERIIAQLLEKKVRKIKVATILLKPESFNKKINIDYVGFKIANDFVVGYGLDYEGLGRNLKEIHVLA
jgi:hypoxanthine phosphoribosyltransferase